MVSTMPWDVDIRIVEVIPADDPNALKLQILRPGAFETAKHVGAGAINYATLEFKDGESKKVLRIFLENFTLKGRTPADDIIDAYKKHDAFTPADLELVEKKWNDLLI